MSELAANLDTYLAGTPETVEVRSLADLLAFNASEPREETARFGQTILERAAEAPGVDTTEHRDRVAAVRAALDGHAGRRGIHGPFEGLDIDNKDPELRPADAAAAALGLCDPQPAELGAAGLEPVEEASHAACTGSPCSATAQRRCECYYTGTSSNPTAQRCRSALMYKLVCSSSLGMRLLLAGAATAPMVYAGVLVLNERCNRGSAREIV